ncbi:putative short chain dehydrogenase/ reductase [Zopfochytrium polystomum]|nr:putative short chain dehydrogenase/ reductase [Zopfochytrium polystomum]
MAPLTPGNLASRSVLVTGGAGGLGLNIVRAFLAEGARVLVVDINEALLDKCKAELATEFGAEAGGSRIATAAVDISTEEGAKAAVDKAVQAFGTLDVLVNNAGIADGFFQVHELDAAQYAKVLAVNVTGPTFLAKYAVQVFLGKETPKGSIVNVGSTASVSGFSGCAYTISKHAVAGLSKNIAVQYAERGIRSNLILPNGMVTAIMRPGGNVSAEGQKAVGKVVGLMGRQMMVGTDKVAALAVHLASDAAEGISGAEIPVDNGFLAI